MAERVSPRGPGMYDFTAADMRRFRRIERAFLDEMQARSFDEIRTPAIEPLHLFTSSGALAPELLERVYSFLDWDGWSGERVVLRPDSTVPAARHFLEHYATTGAAKLCYVQDVFRFEPGDKRRELWQCGAEVYGDSWPAADVELISAGRRVLDALGIDDYRITLSHTGVLRALLQRAGYSPDEQLAHYDQLQTGQIHDVLPDLARRLPELAGTLSLLFDVPGKGAAYIANLRAAFVPTVPEMTAALDELETVTSALERSGCWCQVSVTLARDLEYYTGPVFEFAANGGAVLGRGGRYDTLVQDKDGRVVPACGFALYVERIGALLDAGAPARRHAVQVRPDIADHDGLALALMITEDLHAKGFRAEISRAANGTMRWTLTLSRDTQGFRYHLHDQGDGSTLQSGTVEAVFAALGRAT